LFHRKTRTLRQQRLDATGQGSASANCFAIVGQRFYCNTWQNRQPPARLPQSGTLGYPRTVPAATVAAGGLRQFTEHSWRKLSLQIGSFKEQRRAGKLKKLNGQKEHTSTSGAECDASEFGHGQNRTSRKAGLAILRFPRQGDSGCRSFEAATTAVRLVSRRTQAQYRGILFFLPLVQLATPNRVSTLRNLLGFAGTPQRKATVAGPPAVRHKRPRAPARRGDAHANCPLSGPAIFFAPAEDVH